MSTEVTVLPLHQIAAYTGPHEIPGVRFRPARAALGVSSWGMNVLELDAGCEGYPEHDHAADGQEEVYFVVEGSAVLRAGGQERPVQRGDFVRVPASVRRKFVTGAEGVTLLALGGTPGVAFTPTL